MTRSAPIASKPDSIRYPTVPGAFDKVNSISKTKFLQGNHRACPPNSRRNPSHYGALIDHVLELGSMYHMLDPMDYSTWSMEEIAVEAVLITKDGKLG